MSATTIKDDEYERRKGIEKYRPIGKMYFDNYKHVRVDARTIKLVKK